MFGKRRNPIPETDPRAQKARARYDAWRGKLDRMRQAIEATEARRKGAEDVLAAAVAKALDNGELPPFTPMVTKAGATLAACDAMLPTMRKAYREESRRDLSPEPRVVWKPARAFGNAGPIISGAYVAHVPEGDG